MFRGKLFLILSFILQAGGSKVEVQVKQGKLIGTTQTTIFDGRNYYAFYAVPYAAAPVGKLRFKDPKPEKKWNRPYDARVEFHGACAQPHVIHKHAVYGTENCLFMNIFTPSLPKDRKNKFKPVIVWIHGYAFTTSFSHLHGGDFLIENDVIFISVTHRLSVFGFVKLNESDTHGNMGLKDIVMALKWIRTNIQKFNGDKSKVTVMGGDSAGTFLSLLMMTKSGKLFSKMILQSGGLLSPSIFQNNREMEKAKISDVLKKKHSKTLMNASTKNIIEGSLHIYEKKDWINFQRPIIPFSPMVETKSNKSLIEMNLQDKQLRNIELKIPVMIGFNSQESISEILPFIHNPQYLESFKSFFKFMVPFTGSCSYNYTMPTYSEIGDKIKKKYFKNGISARAIQDFIQYASDVNKYPIYKFIKELLKRRNNEIYVYKFNYVGKFNAIKATSLPGVDIQVKGAAKGDESCYLMRCEPMWEVYKKIKDNMDDPDRKFIKEIAEIWANFAKTGNPTPRFYFGNVTWLPMTSEKKQLLLLGKNSRMINSKSEDRMLHFWNTIYDEYYSQERCKKNKHDEL